MKQRDCRHCGEQYAPVNSMQVLCSDECRRAEHFQRNEARKAKRLSERRCVVCDGGIQPDRPRAITCSRPCAEERRNQKNAARVQRRLEQAKRERKRKPKVTPEHVADGHLRPVSGLAGHVRVITQLAPRSALRGILRRLGR